MNVVPDTSVLVDGRISARVASGEYADATVIVPEAVVAELESQANRGRSTGWSGLEELRALAALADADEIALEYVGRRPTDAERRGARRGDVDAVIREVAAERDATLVTSDRVQSEVAGAKGIAVDYLAPERRTVDRLPVEDYFDDATMSVHLKAGVRPMAKRGEVGDMHYVVIGDEPMEEETLESMAHEIVRAVRDGGEGFIELDEDGMRIVQFRDLRIAIARPPFADGWEITAVRPVVKTSLEDYEFADELKSRLLERQRGVLIAGAPGAGKSTFAQAVAEFLSTHDFAVKTMEKPRDLQVGPHITQYTALGGRMDKTADSLLLVRPDYTIYDELRKTDDFEVFADMRLAGVGMIGVVHATRPIDALGRLVGRVELGMIPQIVDTVVFVDAGRVDTVYDVSIEVKVPHGLVEEDLARPVILVRDFETDDIAYEIYLFSRQVVTIPVGEAEATETGVDRLARGEIEREIRSIARGHVDVELRGGNTAVVYVDEADISAVIGKGGGRISDIEDRLGIDIDVRTHAERPEPATGGDGGGNGEVTGRAGEAVTPEIAEKHVRLPVGDHVGETVEVRADGEYLFTATVGRGGEIQVSRGTTISEQLEEAIDRRRRITVVPS